MKENSQYRNLKLGWVAYISGKRESRRLLGDYILKEDDIRRHVVHEDGGAASTWSIDLHYPDPKNTENFPGAEFKSIANISISIRILYLIVACIPETSITCLWPDAISVLRM